MSMKRTWAISRSKLDGESAAIHLTFVRLLVDRLRLRTFENFLEARIRPQRVPTMSRNKMWPISKRRPDCSADTEGPLRFCIFGREGGDDFFKPRIAAQRIPQRA